MDVVCLPGGGNYAHTFVDTLTYWVPHSVVAAMFSGRHTICKVFEKGDEVPYETLPEPFNNSGQLAFLIAVKKPHSGTLGRHLEEIHMNWALFWKKQDKIATLHNEGLKICLQMVETAPGLLATSSG
ncbi:hypothetical protein Tco_0693317 [Tanacetum coccineum]